MKEATIEQFIQTTKIIIYFPYDDLVGVNPSFLVRKLKALGKVEMKLGKRKKWL